MEKGKYGIFLWFYAVIAFILAFLGQTLLGGLLLGFVILAEKNEWLTKQVLQAFLLTLFTAVLRDILGWINFGRVDFSTNRFLFGFGDVINTIGNVVNGFFGFISAIISLAVLVFCIIGIIKVSKGQDANIPIISKLANKAFGIVEKKVYTNMNQQNNQTPPQQ